MPEVRVSEAAQADILEIGRYTEREWGVAQRRRYLDGMARQFALLAASPRLAAERPEFNPPVRIYAYEKHRIIYLADDNGVLIVRVLHESMDVARRL